MHPLSASTLLEVWERGVGQAPVERALTLLSATAEESLDGLRELSVGQRDAGLMALYQGLFGDTLHAFAECPECGERLEYTISTRDLDMNPSIHENSEALTLECGGALLRLRLPDSRDLAVASQFDSVDAARQSLARRCIVSADGLDAGELSDAVVEQIARQLAKADPRAETLIHLTCAVCSYQWRVVLDIERFLWVKVSALAKRLLREVHVLARTYGWREADILAMTAARRQLYLEMAGA
ncbi:MAG TPA: hypothetical protein VG456_02855 [Candidatus Sulfopaludibacter sp.]|jgi:hypothetical protein|nr:hypothetical protein [Candidatus Sulfopaludibacter sp.]